MEYLLIAFPVVFLVLSVLFANRSVKRGAKTKKVLINQLVAFSGVFIISFIVPIVASAFGDTTQVPEAVAVAISQSQGWGLIASALAVGLAGIGSGIAVGAAAPAAIGATSEDPKNFGKAMVFVALGEGIALYGLLIAFLIWIKC